MNLKEQATTLGADAWARGITCAPVLDRAVRELIGANDGHASEILSGWLAGWHKANAAAPVCYDSNGKPQRA